MIYKVSRHRILFVAMMSMALMGCCHQPVVPDTPEVSFSLEIQPLINSNCSTSNCHGGRQRPSLRSYADVLEIVKPRDARASELYKVITTLSGDRAMPPNAPLSENQNVLVYKWIMQGAKNN